MGTALLSGQPLRLGAALRGAPCEVPAARRKTRPLGRPEWDSAPDSWLRARWCPGCSRGLSWGDRPGPPVSPGTQGLPPLLGAQGSPEIMSSDHKFIPCHTR